MTRPGPLADLAFRARALFRRGAMERELDDELQFHLDRQTDKHVAAGLDRAEAARRARVELGGLGRTKVECREARGVTPVEDLIQDARYGLRKLRASPGFTAVALVILALGIGASTALFSVVNGVLLRALPYPRSDELITVHQSKPNFSTGSIPYPNFRDWRADSRSFAGMAIHRPRELSMTGRGAPELVSAELVTADLFGLLGVEPVAGRTFAPGEDEVGAAPVALLGAELWQRRFHGSPDALGQTLVLDGRPYTIVGVVPGDFDLLLNGNRRDVYLPVGQWDNDLLLSRGAGLGFHGVARLAPGVPLAQARADLDRVTDRLARLYPETNRATGAALIPFERSVVGGVRPLLLILSGAVALVLLVVCVNIANLLLARATGRTREMAIRTALGAGRGRLVRQLLTESMLLALAGGGLGLLVAVWTTPALLAFLPDSLPRAGEISIDGRVLGFALAVSLASGVLFGLIPALRATDAGLHGALRDGGRGTSGRHRTQRVLLSIQMAMVLVLLVGAGLMTRTLSRLGQVDTGLDPAGVTTLGVSFSPAMAGEKPAAIRAHLRQLEARLAAIPGVEAAALSTGSLPLQGDDQQLFWPGGAPRPASASEMNWTLWYVVGPGYRRAMGIPLREGRFLGPEDDERAPLAVVVDDVLAAQYFPGQSPVGRLVHLDGYDRPARIVGVVGHVVQWGLATDATQSLRAQMYFSPLQLQDRTIAPMGGIGAVVRSSSGRPVPLDAVRRAVQAMSPEQLVSGARTMEDVIARSMASRRFAMRLLAGFALLALVLAGVGIYGVVVYAVGQRTAEIGIRMALGARRGDVLRLVLADGARMVVAGIAVGVGAAIALTRLMSHLLYGVSPTDPLTFALVAIGLAAVALAACALPARRAARVEPMIALRHD